MPRFGERPMNRTGFGAWVQGAKTRFVHLEAHLQQREILNSYQRDSYDQLRHFCSTGRLLCEPQLTSPSRR